MAYKARIWDGSEWVDVASSISDFPDQLGNSGKVLSTDGSTTSWNYAKSPLGEDLVAGIGIIKIIALTQAEYDAITPENDVLYVVTD
jgi:hypothetical protein